MRRWLAWVCSILFLFTAFGAAAGAEEAAPAAIGYDFDLFFRLNPKAFPGKQQTHAQGYADLLEILELKGTYAASDYVTPSVDITCSVIPTTKPESALDFHLYGVQSHLVLTSPLLGDEPLLLNNSALMEFSMKAYNLLNLPLPYLALLYPYTADNAFASVKQSWVYRLGKQRKTQALTIAQFANLAADWEELLESDAALTEWFRALSLKSEYVARLEDELMAIPSYLTDILAKGQDIQLTVKKKEGLRTLANVDGVFYTRQQAEGTDTVNIDLPLTDAGFHPQLRYELKSDDVERHFTLLIDYSSEAAEEEEAESLLTLNLDMASPVSWPVSHTFVTTVSLTGELPPRVQLRLQAETKDTGEIDAHFFLPGENGASDAEVLQVFGTVIPRQLEAAPSYWEGNFVEYTNLFSVNDSSLRELAGRAAKPLLQGILDFLIEVPASACQSVMDDLTSSGLLSMALGD